MNNLLLALAGTLILALAALFVGPYFVDWNTYRTVFEEQATRLAGRKVTVEGNVNLRLLPAPYVSFERVRIAGASGGIEGADKPLLEVENYTLWLAVPPLLQGEFEAQAMEIDRPTVRLALTADGGVSWSGFGQGDVDLPFVPRNVAFRDTNIRDGRIEIIGARGEPLTTIADVTGIFSARALSGPFKFTGEIGSGEAVRSVRWSTGRFEETGGLRIKGTVRHEISGMTHAVDGLLQKIMSAPVFTGGVAGKLRKKGQPGFEMKTDVYADTNGAQFRDVTLLLDAEGRPQIINGSGKAEWNGAAGATAQLDLTSRWLDIDRLIADETESSLLTRVDTAMGFLAHALPADIVSTATFKAVQVNFAGEALDNFALKLTRRGATTELEQLTASAPGATHINLTGKIRTASAPASAGGFTGTLDVRGRVLSRFANWLNPAWGKTVAKSDGAFAIQSSVGLSEDEMVLDDLRGQLDETRFTGRMRHRRNGAALTRVALDAPALDVTRFFPDVVAIGSTLREWNAGKQTEAVVAGAPSPAHILNLNVGQLTIGNATFADVALDVATRDGKYDFSRVAFVSSSSLEVDASRDAATDISDGQRSPLRFVLRAPNAAAYDELVQLTGLSTTDAVLDRASRALLPAHIAGSVVRDTEGQALNVRYDGTLAGNPALGRVRIEGVQEDVSARIWTVATDVSLEKPDAMFAQLGLPKQDTLGISSDNPGRIVLYAIGRPQKGMKTDFSLQSAALTFGFSGTAESAKGDLRLAGDVSGQMKGENKIARLLAIPPDANAKLTYTARITRDAMRTALTDVRITTGDANLTGKADISTENAGITAALELESTRLSLATVLEALTQGNITTSGEPSAPTETNWAETAFDFTPFRKVSLTAQIKTAELRLDDAMAVSDAEFTISGSEDRMSIRGFTAQVGAGRVVAEAVLERRPAGAQATVRLRGDGIPIEAFSGKQGNSAGKDHENRNGTMSFNVSATGLGLSPKGVVSVMEGEGQVRTKSAMLTYFSPQVIQDVVADIADDKATITSNELKARLAERLTDRPLVLGAQDVALRVRDGALQVDKLKVDTPAASIRATTFIDISGLRLDSEWRVTPKTAGGATPLPPVTVFFAGDVRKLSQLKPGFGVAALERELTVRRLEGNIDQLEGLQSLGLKQRKPRDDQSANASTSRGRLRPTIGGEASDAVRDEGDQDVIEEDADAIEALPAPPKPSRAKRRTNDSLWQLQGEKPPVELRLQTPEGANPT